MNTEYLQYFEYAYEEENYSAAARRVPVSPQGLKKALHVLEKELGVPLFVSDPDSGKPVPTDYARELYEYAAVFASNTRLLMESFARIRGEERSTLKLGCSLGVIGALGPEFLEGFKAMYPLVSLAYWETNDAMCEQGLRDGLYDLALAVSPGGEGIYAQELYSCPVYFWINANDPLASRSEITLRDLAGRDVALPGEGFKCYETLTSSAREHGVELGHVFEMSEIFHLYEYAASGRGLGFCAQHQIDLPLFARDDSVVAVPCVGARWTFGLERLVTHALGDVEQSFWNYCVGYVHRLQNGAQNR